MSSNQHESLVTRKTPFAKPQLLVVAAVAVLTGVYVVSRIYAASGSLTMVASTTAVNIGSTVTVQIRENSGTDTVNAVQANVAFDSTKLQYMSVDETGSAFGLVAATQVTSGQVQLARGTSGGSPAVSGDQLVTTLTFKALAAGPVPLTFAAGSVLVRSTDNVDILAVKNGVTLNLADLAAPTVPAGLASTQVSVTTATLGWSASTDNIGVTGYHVYRNGTQVGTVLAPTLVFSDSGLTPNTQYIYRLTAYDAAGNVSAQTGPVTVTTPPDTTAPTLPGKPTSATQTMTSISLSWAAATDNVAVTGYRVYRNGTQVGAPSTTSYTDTGLAVNTTYTYTIAAVDAAGNVSALSSSTAVKTLPDTAAPTVPTGLSATASGLSVAMTWTASTDNVAVTGYAVYQDNVQLATTATLTYTASNVAPGNHAYAVLAYDAAGNRSALTTAQTVSVFITGDINRDGKVDVFDLSTLLTNWSRTGTSTSDLNADSVVNIFDLSILLSRWTG